MHEPTADAPAGRVMGRHASGPEPVADPGERRRAFVLAWLERIGLGVAAGLMTLLVLRWAGVGWGAALAVGVAALVGVPLFAWVASTVPGHASHEPSHERGDDGRR